MNSVTFEAMATKNSASLAGFLLEESTLNALNIWMGLKFGDFFCLFVHSHHVLIPMDGRNVLSNEVSGNGAATVRSA